MILTFRPIDRWPDGWQQPKSRPGSPFRSKYSDTLDKLDLELEQLGATEAFLQVDADPGDVRLDGQLRANARVRHPGVILTVDTRKHGTLVYSCDRFESQWSGDGPSWQVNLRAIALGLHDLRRLERYGIADRGEQYAGFAALPPATPMGAAAMTVDEAIALLHEWAPEARWDWDRPTEVRMAYYAASKRCHPDVGGDPDVFRRVTEARDLLIGAGS